MQPANVRSHCRAKVPTLGQHYKCSTGRKGQPLVKAPYPFPEVEDKQTRQVCSNPYRNRNAYCVIEFAMGIRQEKEAEHKKW